MKRKKVSLPVYKIDEQIKTEWYEIGRKNILDLIISTKVDGISGLYDSDIRNLYQRKW